MSDKTIDRDRDDTPDHIRKNFEDIIYEHYRLGRMEVTLSSGNRQAPVMEREEYFRRDARGDYVTNAIKLMWISYKLFRDAASSAYYGSRMWSHWARVNDRALSELPKGYTVSFNMASVASGGFFISLTDEHGMMVEYPDPPDLGDGIDSLFKIVDRAIDAAIAEAKQRAGT